MNTDTDTDRRVADAQAELAEEHAALHALVERVRGCSDAQALAGLLDELHRRLFVHFGHEEYPGGLYDRMGVISASYRDRVRALADDHFRLLSEIRGLARQAKSGGDGVVAEAQRLAGVLREHEDREQALADAARHGS